MAETAKQIDFSQSGNSRISTGGVWAYSVQPFLIFFKYQDNSGVRTYVSAGVGADGLCNEPTYDVHRELVKPGDVGPPYPEEYKEDDDEDSEDDEDNDDEEVEDEHEDKHERKHEHERRRDGRTDDGPHQQSYPKTTNGREKPFPNSGGPSCRREGRRPGSGRTGEGHHQQSFPQTTKGREKPFPNPGGPP